VEFTRKNTTVCRIRQEDFEKFVMQNRKKYDAFNLSAAFTGRVCEFLQGSMTKMILRIKLQLTMLKSIANAL
jgi:hypothetical protein